MIPPLPAEPRRIVFLFSDTGGGHRSAAEAIIEALDVLYEGRIACEMVDFFKQYAPPPMNLAPEIYPPLSRMPALWGMGYRISDGPRRTRVFYSAIWPYVRRHIQQLMAEHPAHLYVSVHQLINTPMARALAGTGIPLVTVVTDMVTTHAAWYARGATHVVVPTEEAFRRGVNAGLSPEQMTVVGMPVALRFQRLNEAREDIRRRLGWNENLPVALMVGGGEGMGPLEEMARAVDEAQLPVTLVIVTGRNQALRMRLERRRWHIPVHVYGFVTEMPAFMRAADILVSKAGPGTISEAFIPGLPILRYSKMHGQEDGNVTYVVETGAGLWTPTPEELVSALRRWLEHPEELRRAAEVCRQLARLDAASEIARILARYAGIS
ncbi:MGDG synthase family glycosyltransferase [Anaerolinea sp.]|uniref:MGDG synthase family glycosyltransferase n=1 Tax=Anaerolinea sp. TaxID=1872519 RepID=UPI002ACDC3C4|nr:glycosyltransferase [Anaerolinea sp.]